jgi:hypothetical protein
VKKPTPKQKVCSPKTGCGLNRPITDFPSVGKKPHGSRICIHCLLQRIETNYKRQLSSKQARPAAVTTTPRQHGTARQPETVARRICSPKRGCGKSRPVSAFPDTPTRTNGSRICMTCYLKRAEHYETTRKPRRTQAQPRTYDKESAWSYRLKAAYGLTSDD